MAGTKGHSGGARVGAGRKRSRKTRQARELLEASVTTSDWQGILDALVQSAKEANVRAAQFLFSYAFGLPTQKIAGDSEAPPIQFIVEEVVVDRPRTGRKRKGAVPAASGTEKGA